MSKQITSINLSAIPFLSSCDSTRAQMAAKQNAQSLTHPNCEIPYVISDEYRQLVENCKLGICVAKDSGKIIFNAFDLIGIYYENLKKIDIKHIPRIKKTVGTFSSQLRCSMDENTYFQKGDIIYSYDNFRAGVPSFGYNIFTGYFPFFG